jgi:hypothetical protein
VLTKSEKNDRIIWVMHNASCSKNKEQEWYIYHVIKRGINRHSI